MNDETKMCSCDCHDNPGIMHMMPCCNFTYQQRKDVEQEEKIEESATED